MTCVVYDCVLGTTLQTASSGGTLGTKTVTFTVPTNGSTRARIKWAITKTVTASSTDFTISKITVNGLGLEFESTRTPSYAQNKVGDKRYELANHLGNVLNVITDRKIPIPIGVSPGQTISAYTANVISYTDYYAFGQVLPNRNGNTPEYRYGFNGMEKDDEIKQSSGTSYDFGARMYDPRIGRWLSVDPLAGKYTFINPYHFALNSPIQFKDEDGKVVVDPKTGEKVVKVNGNWQTASGGAVSSEFIKNSQPDLDLLTSSEVGTKIFEELQYLSTPVVFDQSDEINLAAIAKEKPNSKWRTESGEFTTGENGLLSDKVIITLNIELLKTKAANQGITYEEKVLQTISVEKDHIGTKEQIATEAKYKHDFMGDVNAFVEVYTPLLNGAVDTGLEYRLEKGINIDNSSYIPINGVNQAMGTKIGYTSNFLYDYLKFKEPIINDNEVITPPN